MNTTTETQIRACWHPADAASLNNQTLLLACPDCGAKCSRTSIGDDMLCHDGACPLHVLAGPPVDLTEVAGYTFAQWLHARGDLEGRDDPSELRLAWSAGENPALYCRE
jgi:hypothetical protein